MNHPPLPTGGTVVVHIVDPALVSDPEQVLTAEEAALARRFRFEKDADHWRACRAALRLILGRALGVPAAELELHTAEFGKPFLDGPHAGLHFNLSHCEDLALVALCCDGPVGVDIEPAGRAPSLLECVEVFCHPDEIAALPAEAEEARRAAALLEIWTGKEALLKALGTGLSLAPQTVALDRATAADARFRPFSVRVLEHPLLSRHVARLAAPVGSSAVTVEVFRS
jgi:4'-phosphopantetheinyl transferase